MRDEIAALVYPIIDQGLKLKAMVDKGEAPDIREARSALIRLLNVATPERDFRGDRDRVDVSMGGRGASDSFLGIRYALCCWLDELFLMDENSWKDLWNEDKLEQKEFGQSIRHYNFWDQAAMATSRAGTDALEGFYLCVMLGFRGEKEDEPDELKRWCEATRTQIKSDDFQRPPEGKPETVTHPLEGAGRKRTIGAIFGIVLLLLTPLLILQWFLSRG